MPAANIVPSPTACDFEEAMAAHAFPPATLKRDEKPQSQTYRAGQRDRVMTTRKPQKGLSLREAFNHYVEYLPSRMLAEAAV